MTSRCASCHYPLTILDSVACYECSSYFHVDCGQTFGFPFFKLSADPKRNTFHCTTCRILPFPVSRCDSDSDVSGCGMPSRQLDYPIEGQGELVRDINELKGNVQDVQDLCRDMLREINEIKSINLTLRCSIENLRHENQERDDTIVELKRRLDILEKRESPAAEGSESSRRRRVGDLYIEKDTSQYYVIEKHEYAESFKPKNVRFDPNFAENLNEEIYQEDTTDSTFLSKQETRETQDTKNNNIRPKNNQENGAEDYADYGSVNIERQNENTLQFNKQTNSEIIGETHEWDWRGNKAVELDNAGNQSDDDEDEYDDHEAEEKITPDWQMSDEEHIDHRRTKRDVENADFSFEDSNDDEDEKETKEKDDYTKWSDEEVSGDDDEDSEDLVTQKEVFKSKTDPINSLKKQSEDTNDNTVEPTEESDKAHDGDLSSEGDSAEIEGEGTGSHLQEEQFLKSEESHLESPVKISYVEDESYLTEEESQLEEGHTGADHSLYPGEDGETLLVGEVPEERFLGQDGDNALGEQSSKQEEVQPSESPLVPGESQHTEEDLWEYLKQTVKSVHPSTTQEFIQNFIGTLQTVPEDLLKPVVNANIMRANSPSVTDGDHLKSSPSPDGEHQHLGVRTPVEESSDAEDEYSTKEYGEEASISKRKVSSEIPENTTDSEGYTALED